MNKYFLSLFAALVIAATGSSQVSIPLTKFTKENFNGIGISATAALPAGWKMSSAGTGFTSGYATGTNVTATTQAANSGTPTAGGRYNWATTANTDRAVGFMSDGAYADGNAVFADYINNTGATITNITVSYNAERYRINTGTASVALYSSVDGSTWTAVPAGDISSAVFAPGLSAYDFASPQTVYKTATITGLNITNSTGHFYLRWVFTTGGTASQGLGLDDVSVFAQAAAPVVTGSLRDNLQVDNNTNGQADFGDQIRYTMVIRNTGTADANGVSLANQTPNYTTLNAGSVKTSSLARDDNYFTPLNTPLSGATVLGNDIGIPVPNTVTFFGAASNATTVANGTNTAKSDNGATVLMNADGTFTYTPVTGFNGIDRFAYIATNGNAPDNAGYVTVTVGSSAIIPGAAETYNVTGNISITTPNSGTGNLLNNDVGAGILIGSVNGNVANVGSPIITANGGNLTVNSNGSFIYNPASGYEGPDNFTYTVDNGFSNPSGPVTVTLTIAGMIWFIDNNYTGTLSDGRLGSPFKSLAAFQVNNYGVANQAAANDNIFIYESATNYLGNISLLNGQKFIGQDATASLASLAGITLPLYSAALPATNSANGTIVNLTTTAPADNAITLSAGASNTVRGLTIGNTTGAKLFSTGFGTLTIGDNSLPDVTLTGSGQAMNLSAGTFGPTSGFVAVTSTGSSTQGISLSGIAGTVTFGSTNISGSTTQGILIGTTTATINFGNTVVSAGTDGISFQNNSGLNTKTFGTLSITTTGAFSSYLHSNGGGIVTAGVTTISNGTGNGIDISNNTTAVTFGATTVTKSGAGNAINIANPGASNGNITFGGVTLGTSVTRLTGPAINIVNTSGINTSVYDFGAVSIFTNAATGIIATNVDGTINMSSGTVDVTGAAAMNISGPAGLTTLGMTLTTVNSNGGTNNVNFTNCGGTAIFGGNLTGTAAGATFNVTGGTLALTYNGAITQTANAAMVNIRGGHNTGTLTFNTGNLNATNGTGLQFDNADGTYNFTGTTTLNGGSAEINIINGSAGNFTFSSGTAITSPTDTAINILGGTASVTYNGNITQANAFPAVAVSQAHATGTVLFQTGTIGAINGSGLQFDNADGAYNFTGVVTLNGGDAGIDVLNGSSGTINISNASSNINNPLGELIKLNASSANFTYSGTFTKTNNTIIGILVNLETGGTVLINGTSTKLITNTSGNAIRLTSNTGATINFSGNNLALTTSSGIGFNATGGGTISVAGTGNTIVTTTGIGLNVSSTTISGTGITFRSINTNGAPNGIVLNTTGAGGLTVSGDGGVTNNGSGGTINASVGEGVLLTSAANINLGYLIIQNSGTDGIHATTVNGFVLNRSNVTDVAGAVIDEGLEFDNISGTLTVSNCLVTGSPHNNINFDNQNTNLTAFNLTNSTISNSSPTTGANGLLLVARGNGNATGGSVISAVNVTGTTFSDNFSTGFQPSAQDVSNIQNVVVTGCTFTNNNAGIDLNVSQSSSMSFTIGTTGNSNNFHGQRTHALNVFAGTANTGGIFSGKIQGNLIGTAGVTDDGSKIGSGIRVVIKGGTNGVITVDNNTVREVPNGRGIELTKSRTAAGNGGGRFKVTNNLVARPTATAQAVCGPVQPCPLASIFVSCDNEVASGNETVCSIVSGNTAYDPTSWLNGGEAAYYLQENYFAGPATHNLEGTNPTVATQVSSTNTVTNAASAPVSIDGGVATVAPGTCGSFPLVANPGTNPTSFLLTGESSLRPSYRAQKMSNGGILINDDRK